MVNFNRHHRHDEINPKEKRKEFKKKTGESKLTKPYQRRVSEYKHGIVCQHCKFNAIVITYAPFTPKYCGAVCRNEATKLRRREKYNNAK